MWLPFWQTVWLPASGVLTACNGGNDLDVAVELADGMAARLAATRRTTMPRLTIRLTDEDAARLEAVAALRGMTRADVGRWALRAYVREALTSALPPEELSPAGTCEPAEETPSDVSVAEPRPDGLPRTGDELRAWREARGWTQAQLADALEVSRRTVQSAEKRGDKPLTATVLSRLAGVAP